MDKPAELPDYITAALKSARRPAEDTSRDESRQIAQLMAFFGIRPGMRVADLMASRGYIAGVLAEIVGSEGVVYAQNSPQMIARFKGQSPILKRIEQYRLTNVVDVVAELESPNLPDEKLDAVFSFLFYHDMVWVGTDRPAMIAAVYRALKPGGVFAVVDHQAPDGSGIRLSADMHRIDKQLVVDEVTAGGFQLVEEGKFFVNTDDPLDSLVFDKQIRDRTQKFVLKFMKPL